MKKRSATLSDIASELDIDVSTVSKALNGHPKISRETKNKVENTAARLNYHPNHIATALVKGHSKLIGVMVPHTDESFFATVIRGIEETAKEAGYRIIIFQSNDKTEDEIQNLKIMQEAKVDGIIASPAIHTTDFSHYQQILDQDLPLVIFDRFDESLDSDIVAIDDFKGSYKAVTHLIEQGCRKIMHISGFQHVHIYKERLRGYKQALIDSGLPYDENLVLESDMSLQHSKEIVSQKLREWDTPDAIFASSDYSALGAVQVLQEHNIRIPQQVAVVGFSNESFTSFVTPSITSVEQHARKMGEKTAQAFISHVHNPREQKVAKVSTKTILTPELIVRESSRR